MATVLMIKIILLGVGGNPVICHIVSIISRGVVSVECDIP